MNYLCPELKIKNINQVSILGLAHVGDGVFELLCRTYLISLGKTALPDIHKSAVAMVNAAAQRQFSEKIMDMLSDDEMAVFKRGRNAKVNSVPKNASEADYHAATGLEALFGWLYLQGASERINELFLAGIGDA